MAELDPGVVAKRLGALRAAYVAESIADARARFAREAPVEPFEVAVARRLAELRARDALARYLHRSGVERRADTRAGRAIASAPGKLRATVPRSGRAPRSLPYASMKSRGLPSPSQNAVAVDHEVAVARANGELDAALVGGVGHRDPGRQAGEPHGDVGDDVARAGRIDVAALAVEHDVAVGRQRDRDDAARRVVMLRDRDPERRAGSVSRRYRGSPAHGPRAARATSQRQIGVAALPAAIAIGVDEDRRSRSRTA